MYSRGNEFHTDIKPAVSIQIQAYPQIKYQKILTFRILVKLTGRSSHAPISEREKKYLKRSFGHLPGCKKVPAEEKPLSETGTSRSSDLQDTAEMRHFTLHVGRSADRFRFLTVGGVIGLHQ